MSIVRITTGETEVITAVMLLLAVLQTGLTNVLLKIHRTSDDYIYDFNDNTFKNSGWTSATAVMAEINATDLPGQYKYSFDTSAISNATVDDSYILTVTCASADNVPQTGEIKTGDFVDDIAPILADTNELQTDWTGGGRLDTILDATATEANATTNTNSIEAAITASEGNVRGSDSDDLKTISDQLDTAQADLDNPNQYKADVSALATEANATTNKNEIIVEVDANETKIDALQTGITEILGLTHSNTRLLDVVNDANGNMTSATQKIYPTKADTIADTNAIYVYSITATYDADGFCTAFQCVKDS